MPEWFTRIRKIRITSRPGWRMMISGIECRVDKARLVVWQGTELHIPWYNFKRDEPSGFYDPEDDRRQHSPLVQWNVVNDSEQRKNHNIPPGEDNTSREGIGKRLSNSFLCSTIR